MSEPPKYQDVENALCRLRREFGGPYGGGIPRQRGGIPRQRGGIPRQRTLNRIKDIADVRAYIEWQSNYIEELIAMDSEADHAE